MRRLVIVLALLAGSVCFAAPAIAADGDTATQSVDQANPNAAADDAAAKKAADEAAAAKAAEEAAAAKAADEAAAKKAAEEAAEKAAADQETSGSPVKDGGNEPADDCSGGEPTVNTTGTECPSPYPYEVKVCWKMDSSDGVAGTYEFPQHRVWGSWCDKTPKCGETAEYQHDTYWIRDKDDQEYLAGLWKLYSPAGDAQLEPHNYFSVVKNGPKCHKPKEVTACWKMSKSDGVAGTYEFPQTRVWGDDCDAPPKCGEIVEYQHDSYWIKSKDDWYYFEHLETLNSPKDDARLHPHHYYSVVKTGDPCPIEVTPAIDLKSNCDSDEVPTVVPIDGVVYTFTKGDGQKGPWEITATPADDGHVFADGAQTVFTGDAGAPDSCVSDTEDTDDPAKADPAAENALLPNTGGLSLWILLLAGAMTAAGLVVLMRREPVSHASSSVRGPAYSLILPPSTSPVRSQRAHASAEHIGFIKAAVAAITSFFRGGRR